MNIVLFSEVTVERVIGGAERVLRQQSLGLAKLGHHVRVIARAPCESAEGNLSIGSVTERRYPVTRTSEPAFVWSSVQNSFAPSMWWTDRSCRCRDHPSITGWSRPDLVSLSRGRSLGLCLSFAGA